MKKPDPLSVRLLNKSMDLLKARPWVRVIDGTCFLLRMPESEHDALVTIFGHGGHDHGVEIILGEQSVRTSIVSSSEDAIADPKKEPGEFLNLEFIPFAEITADFRRIHEQARYTARREVISPNFRVHPPFSDERLPNRGQMRLFLYTIEAILFVLEHDALSDSTHTSPHLLLVKASGTHSRPTFDTSITKNPCDLTELGIAGEDAGEAELEHEEELPTLDESWCLTYLPLENLKPSPLRPDHLLLIFETETLRLVKPAPSFPGLPDTTIQCVNEAVHGLNLAKESGVPKEIILTSYDLFAETKDELRELGIEPKHDESLKLDGERKARVLEQVHGEGWLHGEQAELSGGMFDYDWLHRTNRRILIHFTALMAQSSRSMQRTLDRYFGRGGDDFVKDAADPHVISSFIEWAVCAYRPTKASRTLAEESLAQESYPAHEQLLVEAIAKAQPRFYRVAGIESGDFIEVEDLETGEKVPVKDIALSLSVKVGVVIILKIYPAGPFNFCSVAGPPLPAGMLDPAQQLMSELGFYDESKSSSERATCIGKLWMLAERSQHQAPQITTSLGDSFEPLKAHFRVENPNAFLRALSAHPSVEEEEPGAIYTWLEEAPKGWAGGRVVMARLELLGDNLVVEVLARRRLEVVVEWLEQQEGVHFLHIDEKTMERPRTLDDSLPPAPTGPLPPEVIEAVTEHLAQYHRQWLDLEIPALDGRTPREACSTEEGRQAVTRLIRSMPPSAGPGGITIEPPRDELLRELGLLAD